MFRTCITCSRFSTATKRFLATAASPKWSSTLAKDQQSIHPKTILANLCAKLNWRPPEFEYTSSGPKHQPKFSARIKVFTDRNGEAIVVSSAAHSRKTLAMFEASLVACQELKKRGLLTGELPSSLTSVSEASNVQSKTADSVPSQTKTVPLDDIPAMTERHPLQGRLQQHPKSILQNFSNVIKASKKDYRDPKANFHMLPDRSWVCKLSATWPVATGFHARATSKTKAEHATYLKLLQHLRVGGFFDDNWQPKFHSRKEIKEFESTRRTKVYLSPIPDELRSELDQLRIVAKEFEMELGSFQGQSGNPSAIATLESIEEDLEDELETELCDDPHPPSIDSKAAAMQPGSEKPVIMDIITNKALQPLDEQRFMERCHDLLTRYQRSKKRAEAKEATTSAALPIAEKRKQIIDLLSTNRAVIIAGGTGCGKTTQVPQFIFDDFVQRMQGAEGNILITQPRRISAISVSQRVASERYERIGDTIGYHVRLGMRSPVGHGSMLFATPAMILRKLWDNPTFEGISHVIIDEVHERDLWTDFLLIILKRAMKSNDKLKVILMSASMDSKKLSEYFGSCPVITVEGRNYEVQEHFMDSGSPEDDLKGLEPPVTDHKAVVDVLSYVHQNREDGAILCFLPSWTDITKVRQLFRDRHEGLSNCAIYACHSRLPLAEQERIFELPPAGQRKIVLATNIAETSITINDVRYVVNSGTRKNSSSENNLRSIRQEWASQSSQIQRKGRAGRVSHGECFHLFSKSAFDQMRPYDLPSMVKEPLENVVLFCKLCCPKEDPQILLEEALDRPLLAQINSAVRLLTSMKLLDDERNLTTLGAHVARIGCHPMLGLAMVYGSVYRCLEPLVTLTSILQTDGLVQTMSEAEEDSRPGNTEFEMKQRFVGNAASDHLAQVNLFAAYQKATTEGNGAEFITEHCMRTTSLGQSEALRRLFAWELSEIKLCENVEQCLDASSSVNQNSNSTDLVKAVMAAGLHEQIIWLGKGVFNRGRILENKQKLLDEHGHFYMTSSSSLFRSRALSELEQPSQLFCYVNKVLVGGATKLSRVDGLSALSPITTLLFGGHQPTHFEDGVVNLIGYRYQLCTNEEDAIRLIETRKLIRRLVDWTLELKSVKGNKMTMEKLDSLVRRVTACILELTAKISVDKERSQRETDMNVRR